MERAGDAMLTDRRRGRRAADGPADALRLGLHAFFAFVDEDRDAWRVLFDETLPAGGEIARAVGEYRERLLALVAQTLADAPAEPTAAPRHATEIEALSRALLGAAEALARWWLRTGAIPAADAAELLITTIEPGLQARVSTRPRAARPATALPTTSPEGAA